MKMLSGSDQQKCYPISSIPTKYSCVFPYEQFNALQSSCLHDIWYSKKSLVVSAPTGSGKTGLLELAICRCWEDSPERFLAVYIAPMKSLVRERVADWKLKFNEVGIEVNELTGDEEGLIEGNTNTHVICTTPEKWNSEFRRRTGPSWLRKKQVQLYLIDEVHVVGEPDRGPVLEAVLTRTVVRYPNRDKPPRFIAISATISNPEDIGEWLSANDSNRCKIHISEISDTPSTVETHIKGYPCSAEKQSFIFDIGLDYKLPGIIQEYAPAGKSTLVFVSTRNATVSCATRIGKAQKFCTPSNVGPILQLQKKLTDRKLIDIVDSGVAFHHAGLSMTDRSLIETGFVNGLIRVLVATTTLAMGVNLPAYLVIIRGTTMYNGPSVVEYNPARIYQMIGRAGRVQFESSGKAVVMTKQDLVGRYEAMLKGKLENVESYLQQDLIRHLNAEISQGGVRTLISVIEWLRSTFLFVRLKKKISAQNVMETLGDSLKAESNRALEMLETTGLIERKNDRIKSTDIGRIFDRFCMTFRGFAMFVETLQSSTGGQLSLKDTLWLISSFPDFRNIQVRGGERSVLKVLNESVRFKLEGRHTSWKENHKVILLLQSQLGSIEVTKHASLRIEQAALLKIASRVSRCIYEVVLCIYASKTFQSQKGITLSCETVRSIALMAKSLHCGMWFDSPNCLQQLESIGQKRGDRLVRHGFTTFEKFRETDARIIEMITQTNPPFGSRLKTHLENNIPVYRLHIDEIANQIEVNVKLLNFQVRRESAPAVLLVGNAEDEIVHLKRFHFRELVAESTQRIKIEPGWKFFNIFLISETYAGVDKDGVLTSNGNTVSVLSSWQNADDKSEANENSNEKSTLLASIQRRKNTKKQLKSDKPEFVDINGVSVASCNTRIFKAVEKNLSKYVMPDDELSKQIAQEIENIQLANSEWFVEQTIWLDGSRQLSSGHSSNSDELFDDIDEIMEITIHEQANIENVNVSQNSQNHPDSFDEAIEEFDKTKYPTTDLNNKAETNGTTETIENISTNSEPKISKKRKRNAGADKNGVVGDFKSKRNTKNDLDLNKGSKNKNKIKSSSSLIDRNVVLVDRQTLTDAIAEIEDESKFKSFANKIMSSTSNETKIKVDKNSSPEDKWEAFLEETENFLQKLLSER